MRSNTSYPARPQFPVGIRSAGRIALLVLFAFHAAPELASAESGVSQLAAAQAGARHDNSLLADAADGTSPEEVPEEQAAPTAEGESAEASTQNVGDAASPAQNDSEGLSEGNSGGELAERGLEGAPEGEATDSREQAVADAQPAQTVDEAIADSSDPDEWESEEWDPDDLDESEWGIDDGLEFELDTVVVTATRTERDLVKAPATVSVITAEELTKAPVGDLTDALRHTPGLTMSAGTQRRREINLRGMNSAHTLILIDGKRVNSREAVFRHNDFDIGKIPVESIERIEIVRGSVSALYGSEALGGVINIITKKTPDEWTAGFDIKGQSPVHGIDGEEARISAYAAGPLLKDRLGLRVSHSADLRRPWMGTPGRGNPVLDDNGQRIYWNPDDPDSWVRQGELATLEGREDHSTSARLSWTPDEKQTLSAEYARSQQSRFGDYYIGGTLGSADSMVFRDDLALAHEGKWDWGSSLARGYWERIDTNTDGLFQDNLVLEGNSAIMLGKHLLTVGGEFRWTQLQSEAEFESGKAAAHQEAIYAQNEWEIHRIITLLVGARLDHHENFGFWPTPRGYVVLTPIRDLTIKGGVGTGFRSPTLRQMSTESIVSSCRGRCYIIGTPDLKPESSISYEASAGWTKRSYGFTAGVFQNDVSNLIDTPRGGDVEPAGFHNGRDVFVPKNINKALIRGIEASAYWRYGSLLQLTGNYTLLDAWDLSSDKAEEHVRLSNRPGHTANAQIDWNVLEKVSIFGRGQYVGSQLSGDETIPGYMLFDAGLTYKPLKKLSLTAGMLNIGDSRTYNSAGYPYQERGRTAYLGLNGKL